VTQTLLLLLLCLAAQVNYAESSVECRRTLLMQHFGETSFGPEQCRGTCDVCQANKAADRKVEGECGAHGCTVVALVAGVLWLWPPACAAVMAGYMRMPGAHA
jgi:hypothetical protein